MTRTSASHRCPRLVVGLMAIGMLLRADAAQGNAGNRADTKLPVPDVTGARVDESKVGLVFHVDNQFKGGRAGLLGEGSNPFTSINEAMIAGFERGLIQAQGVKILIHPGVYREAVVGLPLDRGHSREAVLVLEGTSGDDVVWTGADPWPAIQWERHGNNLYSHDWPYAFGNDAPRWGPTKHIIGHRVEQVFLKGKPLYPIILEDYEMKRGGSSSAFVYAYTGYRAPAETLGPGEFGVAERPENGRKLWVRLADGATMPEEGLEVAVRHVAIDLGSKRNLVLRNITFEKTASYDSSTRHQTPVCFQGIGGPDEMPENVLVENCRFRWSSAFGFRFQGRRLTLRGNRFNYNGNGGMTLGGGPKGGNFLLEDNLTNFNNWRGFMAGDRVWYRAGAKLHLGRGHIVRRQTAIGNCAHGLWFDIHCEDVYLEDLVLIENLEGLMLEISNGPFHVRRALVAGGKTTNLRLRSVGTALVEDCIFYGNKSGEGPKHTPALVSINLDERMLPGTRNTHALINQLQLGDFWRIERSLFCLEAEEHHVLFHYNDAGMKHVQIGPPPYHGLNNVFRSRTPFLERMALSNTTDGNYHSDRSTWTAIPVSEWMQRFEKGSRVIDEPLLRDPENGDYRVRKDMLDRLPEGDWPQVVLPEETRQEMRAYFAWLGYDPRQWKKLERVPYEVE
ncbi:MAG: hypothetical protein JXR37_27865 [Kiritimatiellae bacterium]|nr:hypothetical protein [Kiritimatiellia bacterium]